MSNPTIQFGKLSPVSSLEGEDEAETAGLKQLAATAVHFIESNTWCEGIRECFVGIAIEGVVGVFLFHISPRTQDVDPWLWVVVGDLPPAYLVTDRTPSPAEALKAYVEEMQAWIVATRDGGDVGDLIPVNVPATFENAANLERRLNFLSTKVIPEYS